MSGIRAARDISHDNAAMQRASSVPPVASEARQVQAMQDLLYDILATGVDSERTDVSIEAIEAFLHEHARTPKSVADFRGFFAQQGLTSRMPSPVPAVAVLPPLTRVAPAQMPQAPRPSSVPPELPMAAHAVQLFDETMHPVRIDIAPQPIERRRSRPLIGLAIATTALIIAATLYTGSLHLMEMRADVARSEDEARQNRALIESLRAQTVTFESSLAANGQLIQRMEQKSDLVLDSLQRAEDEKAAQLKKKRWQQ
jgi:hypothetical protein